MSQYRKILIKYKSNTNATQVYELTSSGAVGTGVVGAGACGEPAEPLGGPHAPHQRPHTAQNHGHNHHDLPKRKMHYSSESYDVSSCDGSLSAPQHPALSSSSRKRKPSSYDTGSAYDDDGGDDSRSSRTLPDKKQNHSEIEKRRRDKMNTYITELSSMIPMCGAMARKLDKLTVLRMAVQHLRSVRGALSACPLTARPRPSFLSERELNSLILHAAQDCFLLVVGCDRGRLLYTSASVKQMLRYDQSELLGQSLFDILHPKDVAKVKEQLSSSDLSPRERLIDAKTMLPLKADVVLGASRLSTGARRSFFCRIKCKALPETAAPPAAAAAPAQVKEEIEPNAKLRKKQTEKTYCVVQCTGYLKSWTPPELTEGVTSTTEGSEDDPCNMSCLVAVGRALPDIAPSAFTCALVPPTRHLQYVSRHAIDGKFLFVDQRVTLALGFLPQELLGSSLYEYVTGPELSAVARTHKAALLQKDALNTPPYSFKKKDGTYARIQTYFKPFRNPWTKDVECLVANNTVVTEAHIPAQTDPTHESFEVYKQSDVAVMGLLSETDLEMQQLIDSQVESHKIGNAIAKEALRRSPADFTSELPTDLLQDAVFHQQSPPALVFEQASFVDNILGVDIANFTQVRNNVPLSAAGVQGSPLPDDTGTIATEDTPPSASPPLTPLGLDGNSEAAMAVIMSLLEADAGLGGPVNFSGLPWPMP
ncbi:hypothetical protein K1T71_000015 [Dendrolimus kikuchii]|uniref:Uncharacterized protein n=1 Tax=Dendrolimus kikuchii TaxID=765133 RepID=A0ACC1DJL7_9NEOP|nr:hypothetical protein K1T71_000015 [Dendrolimus kikuchii]